MIKGLLFDYGGTIDTNGLHWAVVLKRTYQKFDIQVPEMLFSKAYSHGERSLAIKPLVKPTHNFYDILTLKVKEQFDFMRKDGFNIDEKFIDLIANDCNEFAKNTIQKAKFLLEDLAKDYPLVMVSNFYGNLNTVLEDFGILGLFQQIIESAVVGVRKPNHEIYQLGVDSIGFKAQECMVIGDSFVKDIIPAKKVGCRTIWLRKEGWEDDNAINSSGETVSDIEIHDFFEIKNELQNLSF